MTAFQRTDASKLVEIYYTLEGTGESYSIVVEVYDGANWLSEDAVAVWGDLSNQVAPGTDRHIVWNPEVHSITCSNCKVRVKVDGGTFVISNTFAVEPAEDGHLFGTVRDRDTGDPLCLPYYSPATVTVLSKGYVTETTCPDGSFEFVFPSDSVPAGEVTVQVVSGAHYTVERKVIIRENSSASLDIVMTPTISFPRSSGFGVGEVRGKYSGPGQHAYYLDGVLLREEFTAAVMCAGTGDKVRWEDSDENLINNFEDTCTSSGEATFTHPFDTGSDFRSGNGTLTVVVVSGSTRSDPYVANFRVVSPPAPLGLVPFWLYHDATSSALKYMTPSLSGSDEGMATTEGAKGIPNDMPLFGGEDLEFGVTFDAHAEINGDGTGYAPFFEAKAETESEITHKKTKIAGASLNLTATGGATWEYVDGWIPGGWIQSGATLSFDVPPKPVVFSFGPVPCYFRGRIEAAVLVDLKVMAWSEQPGDPPRYLGTFTLDPFPYAEAMLGAGVADVCAVEGYLGGGARMEVQYPGSPALQTLEVYLAGGVRVVFWIFRHEWPLLEYTWDLADRLRAVVHPGEPILRIIPRDYVDSSYASFVANVDPGTDTCDNVFTHEVPFRTNVFGQSAPDLVTTISGNLLTAWVHDDLNRSDTNRTSIEFSERTCSPGLRRACTWSTPGPVWDDGTADFHPQLAALGNGDVLVAWENVNTHVVEPGNPDDPNQVQAALDTVKANMAIAVARYSGTSWANKQMLDGTDDNECLDHSPKIATAGNTAVLTWASNKADEAFGSAARPSTIQYATATFIDETWTWTVSPDAVATVGQPILKSSLAYSGAVGTNTFLVFSADTANGTETPEDQELYAVSGNCTAASCTWDSSATCLTCSTSDSVQDANPQVVFYNGNPIVVWYRAGDPSLGLPGALYKADLTSTESGWSLDAEEVIVTLSSTASSGAADFRLAVHDSAVASEDRMAVVWQEASVDGVDMWYAVYGNDGPAWSWSKPRRLTCDRSMEHAMAPSFSPTGLLMVMYDKVQIEPQVRTVKLGCCRSVKIPNVPKFAQTDLYTLQHSVVLDLAVNDEDVTLSPEDAVAGQMVKVRAKVRNLGSLPAVNVTVRFEHTPGLSDEKTGLHLLGGEVIDLETTVDWALPEPSQLNEITVTAEATPPEATQYLSNNTGTLSLSDPDMVIDSLMVQAAYKDRVFTIRVANNGLGMIPAGEDVVLQCDELSDGLDFPKTFVVQDNIAPGAYRDLSWVWQDAEDKFDASVEVVAVADQNPTLEESDEDNNTRSVLVSGGTRACCDPNNGVCTEAADCPPGTMPLGLGTDCSPDCCVQPVTTGADTCDQASVHMINVPLPGEEPITVTITGDNSGATYADYDGTCQLDIFDPEGETKDRGWWHAFNLNSASNCTDIRVDMCCTDPIHEPQWTFLLKDCDPCGETIPASTAQPPIGDGVRPYYQGVPFCQGANFWQTYTRLESGTYYHPIYSAPGGHFGQYQLHITARACAIAACCLPGGSCALLNELDCDEADGYWLGFGNIPSDIDPVVTCAFGACDLGSCCKGPECQDASGDDPCDRTVPETCMNPQLCEQITGGVYVGGAMCDWPVSPCPVCVDCQAFEDDVHLSLSDRSVPTGAVTAADDFVAVDTVVTDVYVWGVYLDSDPNSSEWDCGGRVTAENADNFRIRVFDDNGSRPGSPVSYRTASVEFKVIVPGAQTTVFYQPPVQTYFYQLKLDPPIGGLSPGTPYWLEVANDLSGTEDCLWFWHQLSPGSPNGNGYSAAGYKGLYTSLAEAERPYDQAFHLEPYGFTQPGAPLAACCHPTCNGDCTDGLSLQDCLLSQGQWNRGKTCTTVTCPTPPDNDDCLTKIEVIQIPAGESSEETDINTFCATNDGFNPILTDVGLAHLVQDIWYSFTPAETGVYSFSMCATGTAYDSLMALYTDGTAVCPCAQARLTYEDTFIAASDEACVGAVICGAGHITANLIADTCYTIRVGGYPGARQAGRGKLEIEHLVCPASSPPEPDTIVYPGDPPVVVENQKMRYLSFSAGDLGKTQAVRVTFKDLPAPYDGWNDVEMWVQQPTTYCENSGVKLPPCPPAQPATDFLGATLGCDPWWGDFHSAGVIHVFHEGIVPNGNYWIEVVDADCDYVANPDESFSAPLPMTQSKWGDLVRSCAPCPCTPPDGVVNIASDVTAVLDKFRNLGPPEAVCAPVTKARADHDWATPNQLIDISDATCCLDAFRGVGYPPPQFTLPGPPPCGGVASRQER